MEKERQSVEAVQEKEMVKNDEEESLREIRDDLGFEKSAMERFWYKYEMAENSTAELKDGNGIGFEVVGRNPLEGSSSVSQLITSLSMEIGNLAYSSIVAILKEIKDSKMHPDDVQYFIKNGKEDEMNKKIAYENEVSKDFLKEFDVDGLLEYAENKLQNK